MRRLLRLLSWRWVVTLLLIQLARASDVAVKFPVSAYNHRLKLTVSQMARRDHYGAATAPEGKIFVVCAATWENVIDAAFAAQRDLPDRAVDDNLAETLLLTSTDGTTVPTAALEPDTAHLDANDHDVVGHAGGSTDAAYLRKVVGYPDDHGLRSIVYLDLNHPGDKKVGDILFLVNANAGDSIQLVYDDALGGKFTLTLSQQPIKNSEVAPPPTKAVKTNDVFAIAAESQATSPGRLDVTVALKSLLVARVKRPVYDPAFGPDEEYNVPISADYAEFAQATQLVADSSHPCIQAGTTDPTASVQILPNQWSRFLFHFNVPAGAKSFDLTLYFNTYSVPGHDGDVQPMPMTFHLIGPAAKKVEPPLRPEAKVDDEELKFYAVSHRILNEFAGQKAEAEQQFLVVSWLIDNPTDRAEEFKSPEQLVWFEGDQEVAPADVAAQGPLGPPPFFNLNPHESRTFETVWVIPKKTKQVVMGIKGNHVAQRFTLPVSVAETP